VRNAKLDGQTTVGDSGTELGRNVFSNYVNVLAGRSRRFAADLHGNVELAKGGWYELHLLRQPYLWPDDVTAAVTVPSGWRIAEVEGLNRDGARRATRHLELNTPTTLRIRIVPDVHAMNLWERLNAGHRSGLSWGWLGLAASCGVVVLVVSSRRRREALARSSSIA
jgi:hypothetical protein